MTTRRVCLLAGVALGLLVPSLSAQEEPVAFVGARVIPVAGPEVPKGVVVVHQGKVVAVGAEGSVAVPAGALNASFETASVLKQAGVPVALQTGFEGYVPRVRVLLFEAAVAAANGLGPEGALAASTIDAAKLLGVEKRVGSLEPGKDGDLVLFDGDLFEHATRCTGVVIEGEVVSQDAR